MITKDRAIVAPWGQHGLVSVADGRYNQGAIVSVPHDDRTALHIDFPKFLPGSPNVNTLGKPLKSRLAEANREGIGEANKGTDLRTTVVMTVNFFNQVMRKEDHFPPQTHEELLVELDKHKKVWDGVVNTNPGLYVAGVQPVELFNGMTTAGKIPYVISSEGWSEKYDKAETPYDTGAKDFAERGIVQAGGWNYDTWVGDTHSSLLGRGLTDEGADWHRALGANGVTIWDGSHGSNDNLRGLLRVAAEPNQSHVRVLVSHAGVQMGRVEKKTRNPSKEAIEEMFTRKDSFFGIATSTSMLPGDDAEAVADAAEYLIALDPTGGKQIGLGFDNNGKALGTTLNDMPTMLHLHKIAEALSRRPSLRDKVEDIMWRNYANFLLNALTAREHAV